MELSLIQKKMKYAGIYTKGQIPSSATHTEFDRTEMHGSKKVEFYHVWVKDRNEVKPVFRDDEEPNRQKITSIEKFWKWINE